MIFWLGTDRTWWLNTSPFPLFVSHRPLSKRRGLPRALTEWALDSGGFTEISQHGRWLTTPAEYITATRRYADEIGLLRWAAPQDWMCEPFMLARTGLTVLEHQRRTVENFLELRHLAADLPFIPVLQGWEQDDYLRCRDMYDRAGIDLAAEPIVGVGSVCRRQATDEIGGVLARFDDLRLHGFGVKAGGIARYGSVLASADSMAWSYGGRRTDKPCPDGKRACAHCWHYAIEWRFQVLASIRPFNTVQMRMF